MSGQSRLAALITAIGADIKTLTNGKASKAYGGAETVAAFSAPAGVATINVAAGNHQVMLAPLGTNITSWIWQNVPAAEGCCINMYIQMGATLRTISTAFGGSVHWLTPVPTHVINKYTVYTLVTLNGGADWFVSAAVEP